MFLQRLKLFFILLTIISASLLIYFWYDNYKFKTSDLDENTKIKIYEKTIYLQKLAYSKFAITKNIPIKISDKMPSNLFGAATLSQDGKIVVFLNKKRFKESVDYMIEDVLPHEYAHALMFVLGDLSKENGGHSKKWQSICKALEGKRCDRFVNYHDVIFDKTNLF
ncbi:SprT-like domain-containing protein [Halarcobacter bivalviorum]|uniref:SprT-like domain-containing protein n=1 Tax=Halarcobacter bivalviorum TaxID=663364 RepID=UPI00100B8BCB|nr:SprT-like domain-containing protein [Halarcobacter bivalviorum]RXK07043.1 sprT domain-containing protein [Halarcobacter bivalviorum]